MGGVTDHRKVEKSVLRDRALTGKCENEVILTIKISHIGFSVVLNPNLKLDFKNFSSRPPRPQKTVFQETRPRASGSKNFPKQNFDSESPFDSKSIYI